MGPSLWDTLLKSAMREAWGERLGAAMDRNDALPVFTAGQK